MDDFFVDDVVEVGVDGNNVVVDTDVVVVVVVVWRFTSGDKWGNSSNL